MPTSESLQTAGDTCATTSAGAEVMADASSACHFLDFLPLPWALESLEPERFPAPFLTVRTPGTMLQT